MAKLILISGGDPQEFELKTNDTIGRHPDNSIQILDRIISKEHATLTKMPDGHYLLRDLNSLNGTFVSGKRISQQQLLRDGDEITLGSTRLLFRERAVDEKALHRVTISPGFSESYIRQKISAEQDKEFRPEREIEDEQHLRRDYERLRLASEVARAVGNELDLDKLLQKVIDKALELLPADRGVILLMDENGQPVPRVAKQKRGGTVEEIAISNSILNEVIREKQAVLSSDATLDSRFVGAHSIIMQGIRSTMCVPLLHGTELLGIMHLDSLIATNAFSEKDLRLFSGIANQAAVAIQNAQLAKKIEFEARTRAQFQRFFSPGMVQQMVEGKLKLDGVGETRQVTVLFVDIRGFTAMTENSDAHEIVGLLNEYFEIMVEVLFRFDGTLDKYVGDEIMAVFGVPVAQEDGAIKAVNCALEMMRALDEFNETRRAENLQPVFAGVGINTGDVVFGAIGSSKTLQYTVIGDAVNTTARLCSLAKPGEIIISQNTMDQVQGFVEAIKMPKVKVKGKQEELTIYRVLGPRDADYQPQDTTEPGKRIET